MRSSVYLFLQIPSFHRSSFSSFLFSPHHKKLKARSLCHDNLMRPDHTVRGRDWKPLTLQPPSKFSRVSRYQEEYEVSKDFGCPQGVGGSLWEGWCVHKWPWGKVRNVPGNKRLEEIPPSWGSGNPLWRRWNLSYPWRRGGIWTEVWGKGRVANGVIVDSDAGHVLMEKAIRRFYSNWRVARRESWEATGKLLCVCKAYSYA